MTIFVEIKNFSGENYDISINIPDEPNAFWANIAQFQNEKQRKYN